MVNKKTIIEKIKKNENVEEAVNNIENEINNSSSKVIVLKGERGSGKSTVLLSKEIKNHIGSEINIYNQFPVAGIGVTNKEVGMGFIKHKFEIEMASVLLNYLKEVDDKNIEIITEELKKLSKLFVYDINNFDINGKFKSEIIEPYHYTEYLIEKIKKIYFPEKLSFLIDRFDWMFNRSIDAQKCIEEYFSLFDQVILTTDDLNYASSYPIVEVNYGKDKKIVREIIKRHVSAINKNIKEQLNLDCIKDETIDLMVSKANGDIDVILSAIDSLYSYFNFQSNELNNELKVNLMQKVNEKQKRKLPKNLQPKFYI